MPGAGAQPRTRHRYQKLERDEQWYKRRARRLLAERTGRQIRKSFPALSIAKIAKLSTNIKPGRLLIALLGRHMQRQCAVPNGWHRQCPKSGI
jgi:hypothetical protein